LVTNPQVKRVDNSCRHSLSTSWGSGVFRHCRAAYRRILYRCCSDPVTDAAKNKLLAAYGIARSHTREYELDHLLDLASGGSSAVQNLFPQPNVLKTATGSAYVHNDKDQVEVYTFHALCAGKVTLAAVQQAMTSDWTTAVQRLGLPMIPAGYTG